MGYATEAARAMVRAGFEQLGLTRIVSTCDVANSASVRVLEKAGLKRTATLIGTSTRSANGGRRSSTRSAATPGRSAHSPHDGISKVVFSADRSGVCCRQRTPRDRPAFDQEERDVFMASSPRRFVLLLLLGIRRLSMPRRSAAASPDASPTPPAPCCPASTITATNDATGVSRTTTTSTDGDFSVPDLQLGTYTIEATLQGFQTLRTKVEVTVSQIASVELKMGLSQVAETINVTASALLLDTVSTALSNVVRPKQVQDLPLNGRDFRGMLQLAPGVAGTSVNGVRTRGNNFQIDGADNNDAFQNTAAVNQGGVSGIAGTLLPIEAIDQFSIQSGGQAEMGRNAGSTVNLVIKSGTNDFHGSALLLQPQRAPVGQLAGGGARLAEAGDPQQPVPASRSADRSSTTRRSSFRPSRSRS